MQRKIDGKDYKGRKIEEYCKLIDYSISLIKEKILHINVNRGRNKRGLVNGLGSVIKFITGNLDASDGERYETLFSRIKNNEISVQNQLDSQFSIISELILEFNSTIQNIHFNNDQIKAKLLEINDASLNYWDSIKELLNHQQILLNLILNIFQDIENSITFCKLGALHPSIIGTHQLFNELQKLSLAYESRLPLEIKYDNILEIESTIRVTCAIHDDEIVYFLKVPLSDNIEYDLYYLRSIPTFRHNDYVAIFPNVNYLLKPKANLSVIPLTDNCNPGSVVQCLRKLISNQNADCESEIIMSGSTERCKYVTVNFDSNWVEPIPESNQHLAIFPFGDKIELHTTHGIEVMELKGVFLISEFNDKVYYKQHPLHSESESLGQPNLLTSLNFNIKDFQMANVTLTLKELNLKNVKLNRISHLEPLNISHYFVPSFWTILLYFTICMFILYTILMYCKHQRKLTETRT